MAVWTSNRRLFLASDGVTVVEASDPRKATLLVPVGGTLPMERAKALGLVPEPASEPAPNPEPEPEPKARATPANKVRRKAAEDK
jgi:hypothetical protein